MRIQSTAILGTVRLLPGEPPLACRDTAEARWWARAVARRLAAREARALHALAGIGGFPALLDFRLAWRDPRRGRRRIDDRGNLATQQRHAAAGRGAALRHPRQRGFEFLRLLDAIGSLDMDDQKGRGIQRLLGQAVQRIVAARPAES
ncbi:MAG: hypothetical protein U1F72_05095 [Gammaproteobacteria bacterium]